MNNILITSAGRRVQLINTFSAELRKNFSDSKVMTTDMKPELSAACHASDGYFQVPRVTDVDYEKILLDICLENEIKMVVPTIDTELLLLSGIREKFKQEGVDIVISDTGLVSICRDKRKTTEYFQKRDIKTPEVIDKNNITFPCFAKPYDGSCSENALALMTVDELSDSIKQNEKMIYMQLVDSSYDEYTVDAYYDRNGVLKCLVPRLRIEVRAGEVSKGVTHRNQVYDYLLARLQRLKGARGCLTIQVFANIETEDFLAIEINPRFGGGYPLSYQAGANYPAWLIQEYLLGKDIDFYDQWENDLLMLRYDAEVLVKNHA